MPSAQGDPAEIGEPPTGAATGESSTGASAGNPPTGAATGEPPYEAASDDNGVGSNSPPVARPTVLVVSFTP